MTEFYKVKDIQEMFNCGRTKAYEIIHTSGIPNFKIGNIIYIPKKNFDDWINKKIIY